MNSFIVHGVSGAEGPAFAFVFVFVSRPHQPYPGGPILPRSLRKGGIAKPKKFLPNFAKNYGEICHP
jgi:hypothetical protein